MRGPWTLGGGCRGAAPVPAPRHFPGNRPGLALSSLWRRSGGISRRSMPWLLALQAEGGLRGREWEWEGGGRAGPRSGSWAAGRGQAGARGQEKGRAFAPSSPRLQVRRRGDGLAEAAPAHQPVRVLRALALEDPGREDSGGLGRGRADRQVYADRGDPGRRGQRCLPPGRSGAGPASPSAPCGRAPPSGSPGPGRRGCARCSRSRGCGKLGRQRAR